MSNTLGPFEIGEHIARGGMGEVWRATHRGDGRVVALKIVMPRRHSQLAYTELFMQEVRAAAGLNHPGIVPVWDFGRVTAEEDYLSHGEFREGSPWLAMEYATLGTLEDAGRVASWAGLRRVLLEILDGLAHAHARGIVHRDLKPANVLLTERDGDVRLLLADFGLSHAEDHLKHDHRTQNLSTPSAGTPAYMAPEQIRGAWRDWGPWTDLYSLGCLAWELSTGEVPYNGNSAVAVALSHMNDDLPPFVPLVEVPPQFEPWLRRMLSKPWELRYHRAADAAWALLRMNADETGERDAIFANALWSDRREPSEDSPYTASGATTIVTLEGINLDTQPMGLEPLAQAVSQGSPTDERDSLPPRDIPPIPADWRRPTDDEMAEKRPGLGLFGVREVPLIAREPERDLIWRVLREAVSGAQPRVILVRGPTGTGKSKLLEWTASRAHEVGAAVVLRAQHGGIAGLGDGIPRMLAQHFGCTGLGPERTWKRVEQWLRSVVPTPHASLEYRAAALTQLVAPADPEARSSVPSVEFGSPAERYAVVNAYLAELARQRPVMLSIDDAQFGADILGFVEHLLLDPRPGAALVLLAVRDSDLVDRPLERSRLNALASHHAVTSLELGQLPDADHRLLVESLAGVEEALATQLVAASHGDTLFTAQLLADWVQRGALVPGPYGVRFAEGHDFAMPATVTEVCESRLLRTTAQFAVPSAAMHALQIAAALGDQIVLDEWRAVCDAAGVRVPPGLADSLASQGIARIVPDGWTFSQGAMRTALEFHARREGRWEHIHALCGSTVTSAAQNGSCVAERRARHFLAAAQPQRALPRLSRAIERRIASSAYEETISLAQLYLETAEANGLPLHDDAGITVLAMYADALRFRGRLDQAESLAQRIASAAEASDTPLAHAEALRVAAGLQHGRGDAAEGVRKYTAAIPFFERAGNLTGVARCAHGRGWLNLNLSRPADALEDFTLSARLTREIPAPRDLAWALQGLAEASVKFGDLAGAEVAATEALQMFRAMGSRSGEGMTLATLGSLAEHRDDPAQARASFRASARLLASFDSPLVAFPLLHLIRSGIAQEEPESVRAALELAPASVVARMPAPFRLAHLIGRIFIAASGAAVEVLERSLEDFATAVADGKGALHPEMASVVPGVTDAVEACDPALATRFTELTEASMRSLLRASRSVSLKQSAPDTADA